DDDEFPTVAVAYADHVLGNEIDHNAVSIVDEVCDYLKDDGKYDDALALYDKLLRKVATVGAKEQIFALINKGICLQLLERDEEAINVFTDIIPLTNNDMT